MSKSLANALLLFAGLLWGGGFIAQETAMDNIGPFQFLSLRFFLATFAVLPLVIYEAKRKAKSHPIEGHHWISVFGVGFFFFAAMALQQVGLLATSVTNAGVLTGLYVVLVPLIAFVFLRETIPTVVWPVAFIAVIGIWLLGGGGLDKLTWGDWLMVLGALFSALHVIAVGRTVTGLGRPFAIAAAQFVVCSTLGGIFFGFAQIGGWSFEPAYSYHSLMSAGPAILYAAFFAGAAAFTIMAVCQQYTSSTNAAILLSSESLFAAVGGAVILAERLDLFGYLGCVLLFSAILAVSIISAKNEAHIGSKSIEK